MGAVIEIQKLPIDDSVGKYINKTHDWSLPLSGGDDYELCFTADISKRDKLMRLSQEFKFKVTKIGEINSSKKLVIDGYDGQTSSYQHF